MSGMSGANFAPGLLKSITMTALPCLPVPRSEMSRIAKRSSSVVGQRVKALRVLRILVDELVLRLRRADAMVIDLVVLVR